MALWLRRPNIFKVSNICGPDPPTPPTDIMQSQYRAMHYSASRGKNHSVSYCGEYIVA